MRAVIFAILVELVTLHTSPSQAQVGYALDNRPLIENYRLPSQWSHNDAGGDIVIRRLGVGSYIASFNRLGRKGRGGGYVEVTAHGRGPIACKIESFDYGANRGADFVVNVSCYWPNGKPADSPFTILAGWPSGSTAANASRPHMPPIAPVRLQEPCWTCKGSEGNVEALWGIVNNLADQVNVLTERVNQLSQ